MYRIRRAHDNLPHHLLSASSISSGVFSFGSLETSNIIVRNLFRASAWFNICFLVFSDVITNSPFLVIRLASCQKQHQNIIFLNQFNLNAKPFVIVVVAVLSSTTKH